MPLIDASLHCPLHDSFRVQQVLGMFDMPAAAELREHFSVEIPDAADDWKIGMIVGPSGSGKTAVARRAFGSHFHPPLEWPADRAVIDCFGPFPIRAITQALTAVGFSSPPAWIKPYAILSNGQKFRCELARALLGENDERHSAAIPRLVVFDEFTSLVDRTVARIGSAAVARAIRGGAIGCRFVAVTCHEDIIPWLGPDWVVDMATQALSRKVQRRPPIRLQIRRAPREAWRLFSRHHYLNGELHGSAQCFVGRIEGRPAAFTAVLPFPHPVRPGWREHRTVCLPDFQGIGIGSAMGEFVASLFVATGKPYFSTTGHPAVIRHRANSPLWKMHRKPGLVNPMGKSGAGKTGLADTLSAARFTAGFEYVGPARLAEAHAMNVFTKSHEVS